MNTSFSNRTMINSMLLISTIIVFFLIWLIYLREPTEGGNLVDMSFMPPINAVLNTLSAFCLVVGYWAIRRQKQELHKKMMLTALGFSTVFLFCYLYYHSFQGDTSFQGVGWIRAVYFFILISHILLSAVMLPLILITLFFALTGKFNVHPKFARFALPIWFYVSVTGVLVYLMLYQFFPV